VPWSARFFDPIIFPDRRKADDVAGRHFHHRIAKAEHDAEEWQNGNAAAGRRTRRPGDADADRGDAGAEPAQREGDAGAATETDEDLLAHSEIKAAAL
jgi:hypothetical protein